MSSASTKHNQKSIESAGNTTENFDFDTWASQVKRQMIASLRRRGMV